MSEFVVCPDCRGHGTDSIQELVFTSDDIVPVDLVRELVTGDDE